MHPATQSNVYQDQYYDRIADYDDDSYDILQDGYFPRGTNAPRRQYFTENRTSGSNNAGYKHKSRE
jgi:hypothetical protein